MHGPENAWNGQLTPVLEKHESETVIPVPQQHALEACHVRISTRLGCSKCEISVSARAHANFNFVWFSMLFLVCVHPDGETAAGT